MTRLQPAPPMARLSLLNGRIGDWFGLAAGGRPAGLQVDPEAVLHAAFDVADGHDHLRVGGHADSFAGRRAGGLETLLDDVARVMTVLMPGVDRKAANGFA